MDSQLDYDDSPPRLERPWIKHKRLGTDHVSAIEYQRITSGGKAKDVEKAAVAEG